MTDDARIINGTYTEVWLDGDYVTDAYGVQAKVSINKNGVNQCGRLLCRSRCRYQVI